MTQPVHLPPLTKAGLQLQESTSNVATIQGHGCPQGFSNSEKGTGWGRVPTRRHDTGYVINGVPPLPSLPGPVATPFQEGQGVLLQGPRRSLGGVWRTRAPALGLVGFSLFDSRGVNFISLI